MRKPDGPAPGCGYPLGVLEQIIETKKSERPLVVDLPSFSISNLHRLKMFRPGENTSHQVNDTTTMTVKLKGKIPKFEIRTGPRVISIRLICKPFGNGVSWCFIDPSTGRPMKTLFAWSNKIGSRETMRALYTSQFQSKIYRKFIRMEKLIAAINGRYRGPARGNSKFRKLVDLRKLLAEVGLADRERAKVMADFPQFKMTIRFARETLKAEAKKLPKGWYKAENIQKARINEMLRQAGYSPT
jgi:hypothetical protein